MNKGFTLLELVAVIIVIGIIVSVAIPNLTGSTDNARKSSEIATASALQVEIDNIHSEWILSDTKGFRFGTNKLDSETYLSPSGYPKDLNASALPAVDDATYDEKLFNVVFDESKPTVGWVIYSTQTSDNPYYPSCNPTAIETTCYTGPASDRSNGVSTSEDLSGYPDNNDYWEYNYSSGRFKLIDK